MAWGTIRRATTEDHERLYQASARFAKRHGIEFNRREGEIADAGKSGFYGTELWYSLEFAFDNGAQPEAGAYLRKLWTAVMRRALGSRGADGIAYGYVGYEAD